MVAVSYTHLDVYKRQYVDLVKNETDEEKRKEYIGVLERKSLRLKVLIEDLFERCV